MKQTLVAATTLLALVGSVAKAAPIVFDFTYTAGLVKFAVPATDAYQILAFGAQGGGVSPYGLGGRGAEIGGEFSLTAGEILQIAVGGAGNGRGGGGGTFVVGPGNTPLVIAGGGGGGGGLSAATVFVPIDGQGGLTGPDGGRGGSAFAGAGGIDGAGGAAGFVNDGGGGGGFISAGSGIGPGGAIAGGSAFPNLTGGSPDGGFGGGGGAGSLGGGGGGGYSGGGGGGGQVGIIGILAGPGGGGGSFDAGTNQILMADFRSGNGEVIVAELAAEVPEPASVALLGGGLVSLAALWRRRRAHSLRWRP